MKDAPNVLFIVVVVTAAVVIFIMNPWEKSLPHSPHGTMVKRARV